MKIPKQNIWNDKGRSKIMSNRRAQIIKKNLEHFRDKRILDIGCAEGFVTNKIKELSEFVIAVELDIEYLKIATKKVPEVFFINASFEHLPFRDLFFDAVLISEVLEHLPPNIQIKGLKETNRVMNHDSKLVITVPYKEKISYLQCRNCGYLNNTHPSSHLHTLDENKISEILPKNFVMLNKINFPHGVRLSCSKLFSIIPFNIWLTLNNLIGLKRRTGYWMLVSFFKK